jgi:hypothetical protein
MSVNQKSGHGTLISVQLAPPSAVFTEIAEQGDIGLPELSRNEFDGTTQNENIDSYVLGVLRRGSWTVGLNWIPDHQTHDHLTGVYKLMISGTMTGWQVKFPQVTPPIIWVMSGQVQSLKPTAPVDGILKSDMAVRLSGLMTIGGAIVGT